MGEASLRFSLDLLGLAHLGYDFQVEREGGGRRVCIGDHGMEMGTGGEQSKSLHTYTPPPLQAVGGKGEHLMLKLLRECGAEWAARRRNGARRWLGWLVDSYADGQNK